MSIKEQLEGLKIAIQMIQTSINEILNDLVSKLVDKLIEQEQIEDYESSDSDESEYNPQSPESDRYVAADLNSVPPPPPLIAYGHRVIRLPDEVRSVTPHPVRTYIKQHYDSILPPD